MDVMEMAKTLAGAGDRVLLILIVVVGIRYLANRDERRNEDMRGLFKEANDGRAEVTKVVAANTEVLRQAVKKLE